MEKAVLLYKRLKKKSLNHGQAYCVGFFVFVFTINNTLKLINTLKYIVTVFDFSTNIFIFNCYH